MYQLHSIGTSALAVGQSLGAWLFVTGSGSALSVGAIGANPKLGVYGMFPLPGTTISNSIAPYGR